MVLKTTLTGCSGISRLIWQHNHDVIWMHHSRVLNDRKQCITPQHFSKVKTHNKVFLAKNKHIKSDFLCLLWPFFNNALQEIYIRPHQMF